ncbi:S26 family signal peptidase [Xenorhabdus bovienii]|uniref:S26 family signal peptidase n=1 Tax=Xenorhabdus bovienii TaxID=40576 RepID=UPI0023B293A0|nr:S26 family signal peptidase [Xenorhabdus bovienii]MDE9487526.1 S26 family signal peptidase [Xenorhabdus bovienii]
MDTYNREYFNIMIIILIMFIIYSAFQYINIPLTSSVLPHVLIKTGDRPTQTDDYVIFTLEHPYLPHAKDQLTKRIGCIERQKLERINQHFYCDNKLIAIALERDIQGASLPVFSFTGTIPAGKAFLVGDTPNSFDSRYWGFFDIQKTEKLIPII